MIDEHNNTITASTPNLDVDDAHDEYEDEDEDEEEDEEDDANEPLWPQRPPKASNGRASTFYERQEPDHVGMLASTKTTSAVPVQRRTTALTSHPAFSEVATPFVEAGTTKELRRSDPETPRSHGAVKRVWDTLGKEARLEFIETALAQGYSQGNVAKTLGVSPRTIRDYMQVISARQATENLHTLQERIDLSVMRRLEVIRQAYGVVNNKQEPATARVAALTVVTTSLDALDKLQGTQAPESVNAQALADAYYAVTATLNRVADSIGTTLREVGLDPEKCGLGPEQIQALYIETLQQQVHGTTSGVLLGAAQEPIQQPSVAMIEAADATSAQFQDLRLGFRN